MAKKFLSLFMFIGALVCQDASATNKMCYSPQFCNGSRCYVSCLLTNIPFIPFTNEEAKDHCKQVSSCSGEGCIVCSLPAIPRSYKL